MEAVLDGDRNPGKGALNRSIVHGSRGLAGLFGHGSNEGFELWILLGDLGKVRIKEFNGGKKFRTQTAFHGSQS